MSQVQQYPTILVGLKIPVVARKKYFVSCIHHTSTYIYIYIYIEIHIHPMIQWYNPGRMTWSPELKKHRHSYLRKTAGFHSQWTPKQWQALKHMCMQAYIHIHSIYTYTCVYTYILSIHICLFMYVHMYMYILYMQLHMHTYTRVYASIFTYMQFEILLLIYFFVYVCIYIYTFVAQREAWKYMISTASFLPMLQFQGRKRLMTSSVRCGEWMW